MTLDEIRRKCNYFAAKDIKGNTMSVAEFNMLLPSIQYAYYNDELGKIINARLNEVSETALSVSPLRVFKAQSDATIDDGVFPIPADYVRWIDISSTEREIDVVTETTFAKKKNDVLSRSNVRPFCYLTATDIIICPWDIGATTLKYLRTPLVPYYDYCQDATTLQEIYMPVGSYMADAGGTTTLYGAGGVVLHDDVIKDGTLALPYNSLTVELEWEAIVHDKFVLRLLAAVGLNISELELAKYAEEKQK